MLKSCESASRLISESHERPLTLGERWALRLHLTMCRSCRRFAVQLEVIRRALRRIAARPEDWADDADLSPAARERIRAALGERIGHGG